MPKMKHLRLLVCSSSLMGLLAIILLFSEGGLGSGRTLSSFQVDLLAQHWVHSREEDPSLDIHVYRPDGFKQFPPSRFRMRYIFKKNGECEWFYLAPNDQHHFRLGSWRVDHSTNSVLIIVKANITESFRVVELNEDRLVLARIRAE